MSSLSINWIHYRFIVTYSVTYVGPIHIDPKAKMNSKISFDKGDLLTLTRTHLRLVNFKFEVVQNLIHYPRWFTGVFRKLIARSVKWNLPNKAPVDMCCQSIW